MGAGDPLGMEPPVVSRGQFKGQLLILIIVFSDVNMETVGGQVVEGTADRFFLPFPAGKMALDVAVFRQLFFDLSQVFFLSCNI